MIRLVDIFKKKSPEQLAREEYNDAMRELLLAQTGQEYAARMVQYHQDRIKRLRGYLKEAA